jgi:7-carboxy-7-deazaguanine synthase (Cx14CxxC type)
MPKDKRTYKIKEIYYTIQGEGFHTGQAAVFVRFSGCNLWNGLESSRPKAICQFCDTDFVGTDGIEGGTYTADELSNKIKNLWPDNAEGQIFSVFTGGEPALQLDESLIDRLHQENIFVAIETNGTIELVDGIDWICMSPKAGSLQVVNKGNELKLVYPQDDIDPVEFQALQFDHFFLQPKDDVAKERNTTLCLEYVQKNPQWRLSLQTHKYLDIP